MNNSEKLLAVISQLRGIFLEKGELKGYDDWDAFFGCINAIEDVAESLGQAETAQEEENNPKE